MALYRKYRPATFGEVVGQEHVTRPLSVALDTGRINHAYLFSGPRGCGKTSSARILARSLNCEQGPTSTPCGVCNSCRSLAPGGPGNLDVTELDAASHNGVEDMRELRDRAFFAPAESRYRVFIIDEAHMITTSGSNALLKIVEEPPEHLIFIFATTEPERVIGTIRSRTHHYPFRLLTPLAMRGLLERTCAAEGVHVEDSVFPLVIRAGGGSPRDSLSVLDQLLAGAGPDGLTYDLAIPLLGVTDASLIDAAIAALAANDNAALFLTVDDVIEAGYDPRRFTMDLLDRLRDLLLLRSVPDALSLGLVDAPTDRAEVLSEQANMLGSEVLSQLAALVNTSLPDMRGATSPRLLLEILCARMLMVGASKSEHGEQAQTVTVSPSARKFERPSRRAKAQAAAPEPQPQPAQQPAPPEPPRPAPLAPKPPAPADAPAPKPSVPSEAPEARVDRIRRKWARVRELVENSNKVAAIMLAEAKVLGVRDGTLIIGHNTGALAGRINAENNNRTIVEVLRAELGYDLGVRCVVGTNPESAGFAQKPTTPDWKPAAQRPELTEPAEVTPTQAPPQPAPPQPKPTSVWGEPAKLGGQAGPTHTPTPEDPPKPRKRWQEAAARGNERLRNNPQFSDGVPLPPEPSDPFDAPPEEAAAAASQVAEEEAMVREAAGGRGAPDRRDARTVAMEMLERELGARPL